jgi:3-deoxy-7-phosphoheptulonate synthase
MSLVLVHGGKKPVIRVGRFAGQYAKPRSSPVETREINGAKVTLPSYFGDLFNRSEFTPEARRLDPDMLVRGYKHAALTLNFIRALVDGGFADLHHPENWNLQFFSHADLPPQLRAEYERMTERLADGLRFMEALGDRTVDDLTRVEFFTSHEGLSLFYEAGQTRQVPRRQGHYNLSTHMPWIGMRTAQLDGAHVEYCRGIANPVGVKVGAAMDAAWLQRLVTTLNPQNIPGKLALIHRYGAKDIESALPKAIQAVRATGHSVLWICDPMHGNTETSQSGLKTRRFENILRELELASAVHHSLGSHLGGVHVELTGEDVTECTGGARGLADVDLQRAYKSSVDPRLNYEQALELSLMLAEQLRAPRRGE